MRPGFRAPVSALVAVGLLIGSLNAARAAKRRAPAVRKKSPPAQARMIPEAEPGERTRADDAVKEGRTALEAGRYFSAERAFTFALSFDPRHPDALAGAAEAAFENANYEQARGWAERAVVEAETATNYLLLGHANAKLGGFEAAVTAYTRALQLRPNDDDTKEYLRRAQAGLTPAPSNFIAPSPRR